MDDSESTTGSDAETPDGGLLAWVRRLWRRMAGPPPQLLLSDIVSPDALPICPECTLPHHPLASRCPQCNEWVGTYRTMLYPDLIWIYGRGLWRLMRRPTASRLMFAGIVVLGLRWLMAGVAGVLGYWFSWASLGNGDAWLERTFAMGGAGLSIASAVAGWHMMQVARKTWRTWRVAPTEDDALSSADV